MGLPLSKRDFDIFLSHAHADHTLVAKLDRWLSEQAGFKVWFDARELGGGSLLATDLQAAIERCRAVVLVASAASAKSGWVASEYNSAMDERARDPGFRVIALRSPDADVSTLMKGLTWIDLPEDGLTASGAHALLRACYPGERHPDPGSARDVYVSASWRPSDSASSVAVSRHLVDLGFRLVGDARDQAGFGAGDRVEQIMASCGAFVAVVPFRGVDEASAVEGPYKYFMREIDQALALGLPSVVMADPRVSRVDGPDAEWRRIDTDADIVPGPPGSTLEALWDEWRDPPSPQYIFFAVDLESDSALHSGPVRHMVERVTGMPTITGNEIHEDPIHSAIVAKIQRAFLVLADITDDSVNVCIEAGMGLAAGRNVAILTQGPARRPPFMLRSLQLSHYDDEVAQVGVVHKIVRPFRRRIINAEI